MSNVMQSSVFFWLKMVASSVKYRLKRACAASVRSSGECRARSITKWLIQSISRLDPAIKANSEDGPITVSLGIPVSIRVNLNPGILVGQNADWWVAESTPSGVFNYYNLSAGEMVPGLAPTYQGHLFNLGATSLLNSSDLTVGTHTFYFGVDLKMNGSLDMDSIYYDSVGVNVVGP